MNIYETWLVKSPIANRGLFNEKYPENSISAFKNAIKNKLSIKLDVSCLADGTPVVFHDEKLARMTGRDGFISGCAYKDIEKLTLIGSKEKIPTLAEALDAIDGKVPVLIEVKNYGKVGFFEKEIWKVLQSYSGEYAIQSFNPYSLEWFKNNAPKVKRGQLASFFKDKEIAGVKRFSLKRMLLNKKISEPNFINYAAEDLPNKYVKKYIGKLPVLTFTIKSADEEERIKDFCDNIVFDSYIPASIASKIKTK